MDNKVYIIECTDYDEIEAKLEQLLTLMGGIENFMKSGERIVLKPNLLAAAEPERAVTTHPALVAAMAKMTAAAGVKAILADSPGSGYGYNTKMLERVYRACGMQQIANNGHIELNFDTSHEAIFCPDAELIKRFEIITPILKADAVINLCKLKTHSFMGMTGAIKNSFGVIPGLSKPGYHAKLHDSAGFADMLLDLSNYVAPRISIMDAVIAHEGDGPSAGTPRQVGYLIGATNPLALDVVAGEIMGIPAEKNPVLCAAKKRDLQPCHIDDIELIGADKAALRVADFKLPATIYGKSGFGLLTSLWMKPILNLLKSGTTLKPRINRGKCIACGICRDACPVNTISIIEKRHARINYQNCIRCYCCHEMCPENAIALKPSLLYRILYR
ncbi:DUF362 domain-containing protein [candidate division KSB1 bacterium]|nr:DUF362 domain-containing protein [candidate division KSB1 bacterium]